MLAVLAGVGARVVRCLGQLLDCDCGCVTAVLAGVGARDVWCLGQLLDSDCGCVTEQHNTKYILVEITHHMSRKASYI